ncbi:WcaF family extracellular polysaccharide biosynthesis acetyltransferase [Pedobacter frigoris]|uniref:Colanic acid biosynthesis acetyltransferase WcaF n=1 Tax=Pedobacter frigoris TaxID=2571272 RepID=A0A4U1CRX9_9SPHI|nr:WcaF family extracellular polysaccharide biosynthesis acetyltransferase [Pedobacter frigoris]TKC08639.1 colanic acid biosynthesis acetyltransferase WcaF [Pedobacter frigoris]
MDKFPRLKKAFDKGKFSEGASKFKIASWYLTSLFLFQSGLMPFSNILVFILKIYGAKIGKDVRIKPFIHIKYPWKLSIGDHSWIGACQIENLDSVTIGSNVCISQNVMLLTGNHNYKEALFDLITKPIILEDGVWICANAIVCPGVTAYSQAVLCAGSVTSSDLKASYVYRGNPAMALRKRA